MTDYLMSLSFLWVCSTLKRPLSLFGASMSEFKWTFLSAILISLLAFIGIILNLFAKSLALEIGLTIFALSMCMIYVSRFSQEYGLLYIQERKLLRQLHKHILHHYINLPPQEMWQNAIVQALDKYTAADKRIALLHTLLKDKVQLDMLINAVLIQHQETQVLSQLGLRWDKVANDNKLDEHRQA